MKPRRVPLLVLSLMAFLAASASRAQCGDYTWDVRGRVLLPAALGGGPVPCCDVDVNFESPPGHLVSWILATTALDGTFATCLTCSPGFAFPGVITANPRCCNAISPSQPVDHCPLAGDPAQQVNLGDITCLGPAQTGRTDWNGNAVCRNGLFLDPVANSPILLQDATGAAWFTRTDAGGKWQVCIGCPPSPAPDMTVTEQACGGVRHFTSPSCDPSRRVDTFVCDPCPVQPCPDPHYVKIIGRVVCDANSPPTPVVGCGIGGEIRDGCTGADTGFFIGTFTGPDGRFEVCDPCGADEQCANWVLELLPCCNPPGVVWFPVSGCPPIIDVGDIHCTGTTTCAMGPQCAPGLAKVEGTVTCLDASGAPRPVPSCDVILNGPCIDANMDGTCDVFCGPFQAQTDGSGHYDYCMPCECATTVDVSAACCQTHAQGGTSDCSTPAVIDVQCASCTGLPPSCNPSTQVHAYGVVTCLDLGTGRVVPVPGCPVVVDCPGSGSRPVTATTDASGAWSTCYPCAGCTSLRATATCCGASRSAPPGTACGADVRLDISCGDCAPPRSCTGALAVKVTGRVLCNQPGTPTALAGCVVTLTGLDPLGNSQPPVTATTDGTGTYTACVPCGPSQLSAITAAPACCPDTTTTPINGCPDTATLQTVLCSGCNPCPAGYTRVEGRVHCRGGGPVAGCQVEIDVDSCGTLTAIPAVTDAQGRYRACVPCPCAGGTIVVRSLCCNAMRVVPVANCRPVTPIPTLFCPSPCR